MKQYQLEILIASIIAAAGVAYIAACYTMHTNDAVVVKELNGGNTDV